MPILIHTLTVLQVYYRISLLVVDTMRINNIDITYNYNNNNNQYLWK